VSHDIANNEHVHISITTNSSASASTFWSVCSSASLQPVASFRLLSVSCPLWLAVSIISPLQLHQTSPLPLWSPHLLRRSLPSTQATCSASTARTPSLFTNASTFSNNISYSFALYLIFRCHPPGLPASSHMHHLNSSSEKNGTVSGAATDSRREAVAGPIPFKATSTLSADMASGRTLKAALVVSWMSFAELDWTSASNLGRKVPCLLIVH
jgi:hypothetical protein